MKPNRGQNRYNVNMENQVTRIIEGQPWVGGAHELRERAHVERLNTLENEVIKAAAKKESQLSLSLRSDTCCSIIAQSDPSQHATHC